MTSKNWVAGISAFTAFGIIAYWTLVFAGWFPVVELLPGYQQWFLSFPLADGWIALAAIGTLISLQKRCEEATLFGALTGSALIFLGLYALAYGVNTGLIFKPTVDEYIEIAIKLYCLTVGPLLIWMSWQLRHNNALSMRSRVAVE